MNCRVRGRRSLEIHHWSDHLGHKFDHDQERERPQQHGPKMKENNNKDTLTAPYRRSCTKEKKYCKFKKEEPSLLSDLAAFFKRYVKSSLSDVPYFRVVKITLFARSKGCYIRIWGLGCLLLRFAYHHQFYCHFLKLINCFLMCVF